MQLSLVAERIAGLQPAEPVASGGQGLLRFDEEAVEDAAVQQPGEPVWPAQRVPYPSPLAFRGSSDSAQIARTLAVADVALVRGERATRSCPPSARGKRSIFG